MKCIIIYLLAIFMPIVANAQFYTIYKSGGGKVVYSSADVDSIVFSKTVAAVTTGEATNITKSSAQLSGTIVESDIPMTCGIIYDTTDNISSTNGTKKSTTSNGSFSITLTDLKAGTTYYYRAYAIDCGTYLLGNIKSFTTTEVVSSGQINGHDWVDLGLPSGLKWATCNVGASVPEEYGSYFAWGEVKTKSVYSKITSDWFEKTLTYLQNVGVVDSKYNLRANYDAATANWGSSWRMPTRAEIQELIDYTTTTWTTIKGVCGRKVTSTTNGNSIFLPAAGHRYYDTLREDESDGSYISATPTSENKWSYGLSFYSKGFCVSSVFERYIGRTVRAVSN